MRPFWKRIQRYKNVSEKLFLDPMWQTKMTLNGESSVVEFLREEAGNQIANEAASTRGKRTMHTKVSPYILSRMDFSNLFECPVRRQFIPFASDMIEHDDHPMTTMDPVAENKYSPVPGLVHRYPEKVLFLATSTCPTYCRFCTRSYGVGRNTESTRKMKHFHHSSKRWERCFEYLRKHEDICDVTVSGGDTFQLTGQSLEDIGNRLLDIPHIERVRFATKGLSVLPMKIFRDRDWLAALIRLNERARSELKQISLNTHINHPNEMSWITTKASSVLHENGIVVRNQSVLLRHVNDKTDTMERLIKKLSKNMIQPYYVYACDLVSGTEDMRTPLSSILRMEDIRGRVAGFNTPQFVVDLTGGGGKRNVWSHVYYCKRSGISVFRDKESSTKLYYHFDPLHSLSSEVRNDWLYRFSSKGKEMLQHATASATTTTPRHLSRV